jgi:hypothetical protein
MGAIIGKPPLSAAQADAFAARGLREVSSFRADLTAFFAPTVLSRGEFLWSSGHNPKRRP